MDLSFINFKMDPFQIRPSPESVFDLPKTILSGDEKSKLVAEVNSKGELEVKEFSLKGGDVDLFLKGKVVFAPKIEDSKIDLKGKLSLTEKFGQSFPPLILAMFEQQKEEDGSYELQISGPLRKPTNIMIGKFRLPL